MIVAVFGANGFLGSEAVSVLQKSGYEAIPIVRSEHNDKVDAIVADVTDYRMLTKLSLNPDVVVICSAKVLCSKSHPDNIKEMMAVNTIGTANIVKWAIDKRVSHIVNCSTLAVVKQPWPTPLTESSPTYPVGVHSIYAASKLAGEIIGTSIANEAGIPFVNLRFSAIYGVGMAWHGVLPKFIDTALEGGRPKISSKGVYADFLHLKDAARTIVAAIEHSVTGIVNVASGREIAISRLAEIVLIETCRQSTEYDVLDAGNVSRAIVDTERMRNELKVIPEIDFETGVREVIKWRRTSLHS